MRLGWKPRQRLELEPGPGLPGRALVDGSDAKPATARPVAHRPFYVVHETWVNHVRNVTSKADYFSGLLEAGEEVDHHLTLKEGELGILYIHT